MRTIKFKDRETFRSRLVALQREADPASPWKINPDTLVLFTGTKPADYYEVDLEAIWSAGAALDWICQVAAKGWLDNASIGALVRELDRIFNFQASLCGGDFNSGSVEYATAGFGGASVHREQSPPYQAPPKR
jgi:hypothetical protein